MGFVQVMPGIPAPLLVMTRGGAGTLIVVAYRCCRSGNSSQDQPGGEVGMRRIDIGIDHGKRHLDHVMADLGDVPNDAASGGRESLLHGGRVGAGLFLRDYPDRNVEQPVSLSFEGATEKHNSESKGDGSEHM